jgi:two-component system sensor histidine kinase QseC
MTRRTASLQSRLLAGVLGGVGLAWLLAAALVWVDARHELDELLDAHLAQSAALLVAQQTHNGADDEDDEPADAPSLHRYAPNVAFQVWHDGRLMLRSANVAAQPLSPLADGFATIEMAGLAWRLFAARGTEADVQVFVAEQLHSRGEILKAVLRGVLMPALLMLPLVGGAAWWAVRSGLAPLRSLSEVLSARSPQALAPVRLDGGAPAELRAPLDALNQLLGRMATLLDGERRFTADAAHELRTPIAAVRAQAQVALGAQDAAERQHALQATLAGCDRATHLVQQLLTLARLETAEAPPPDELADLPTVARQVIGDLVPDALARDQAIVLDAPARCSVAAHASLVSVLLRNLVDNALRYSPAGASVQVSLSQQPGTVTLSVEDSGPGLPAEHLARLGERFFRPPGQEATGSGLGWSIVRRIAQAQGAQVQICRSTALGGLAVRVVWALRRTQAG